MDGGSAYGVGNTMAVVGIATTTGYSQAVVQVSAIYDNVGDSIRVLGVSSESLQTYNDLYRITGVEIGAATTVTVKLRQLQSLVYQQQVLDLLILRTLTSTLLVKHCVFLHWIIPAAVVLLQLLPQTVMV